MLLCGGEEEEVAAVMFNDSAVEVKSVLEQNQNREGQVT